MKDYIDSLLQEIKEDRTTGAGELVKKGANTVAPLSLLTAIVTEEGMIPGSKIAQRFQRIKVSNHFPM
jgi:translation initiation factor 2B subunit (eIF-2B alpha/beta/delta family)